MKQDYPVKVSARFRADQPDGISITLMQSEMVTVAKVLLDPSTIEQIVAARDYDHYEVLAKLGPLSKLELPDKAYQLATHQSLCLVILSMVLHGEVEPDEQNGVHFHYADGRQVPFIPKQTVPFPRRPTSFRQRRRH